MFKNEKHREECLNYIDLIQIATKKLHKYLSLNSSKWISLRLDLTNHLLRYEDFVRLHSSYGMSIRNAIRNFKLFPFETELPDNFYDTIWVFVLLGALDFTREEYDKLPISNYLTSNKEATRHIGWCLEHLYGARYA